MARKSGIVGTGADAMEPAKKGDLHTPLFSDGKTSNTEHSGLNNMETVAGPTGGETIPNPLGIPGVGK